MSGRIPQRIVVLGGGVSAERAVSLESSRAVHRALAGRRPAEWIDLKAAELPRGIDPATEVIFPVLHGTFGEDGALQSLLEAAGFAYVGCDATASALCMDKARTKAAVAEVGVPVAPSVCFGGANTAPSWDVLRETIPGGRYVLKPMAQGSSVGLAFIASKAEWDRATVGLDALDWIVEPWLEGHDVTVGVLDGEPLGVVGIFPADGAAYDYAHKYTAGATRYEVPASMSEALTTELREAARRAFAAVGARDFARIDFFRHADDTFTFLEVNTIPGLTATSLLPKSASILGLEFEILVDRMLAPALQRFAEQGDPS